MAQSQTYSFINTQVSIIGPNGAFSMGYGAGVDEGGVTIEMAEDKATLATGADGTPMVTLHAGQAGRIIIRMLKTSPSNQLLDALYAADTSDAAVFGQNTISIANTGLKDLIIGHSCGQQRYPGVTYGKAGPMMEWSFLVGILDHKLGATT